MLRCLPEQGSFFPFHMTQGFPGEVMAPWGCCQLCYTMQTRWGSVRGAAKGARVGRKHSMSRTAFLANGWLTLVGGLGGGGGGGNASIWGSRCCSAPARDHCCVAMAVVTNWQPEPASPVSPSPCAMMLWERRAEGALHPGPHLLFTSPSPCRAEERENCLCRLPKEKPVWRQGPRSGEGL